MCGRSVATSQGGKGSPRMKIMLSRNCHIRQFGPYTHVFNHVTKADRTYEYAEIFATVLRRTPIDLDYAIRSVLYKYEDAEERIVAEDLRRFIGELVDCGCVIMANTEAELYQKDLPFSYDAKMPSTSYLDKSPADDDGHEKLHKYFEQHPSPFQIHFDLTSACTEKCIHCYVPQNKHFYINTKKCFEVMDQLREVNGMSVTLSGGECMLHPDFDMIIRHARECDFSISVLSNLTLCDMRKAELLREMNVSLVQVSLYSMDPKIHDVITQVPGSFEKTKTAIETLHALDVPVQISCPTMKANYRGYKAVLEYAKSMKMKAYTDFIIMARSDHTTDNLDNRLSIDETEEIIRMIAENEPEYKSALKEDNRKLTPPEIRAEEPFCGVCIDSICLNADGNYYACSGFQDYPLGNCYKQTLMDVWTKSPQVLYLRSLRGKAIPQCVHCVDREFCSTCLVRNFNETGDMLKVSKHFCDVARLNHMIVDEYRAKNGVNKLV